MKNYIKLITDNSKFDVNDVVFFIYEAKVQKRRIRLIDIPRIIYDVKGDLNLKGSNIFRGDKIKYGFSKDLVTYDDFILKINDKILLIDADKCFETKEKLLKSL